MAAQRKDSDTSDRRLRGNDCGRGRQSGYLLLPVAVAIALIGVIAFLISRQSAIEVDLTAGELNTARAEYVAQAGLQHALRQHAQHNCGPYSDLTNYPFGSDEYDTKLTHDLVGTANYSALTDQDTWIRSDNPTANNASDTKLEIRFESGKIQRPMYRYDLSSIPAKATVLSARAWFYVAKEHPEGPADIHRITADWTETDATWDSMGASLDSTVLVSIPAQPTPGIWVSVNLTAQVQSWVNGQLNYGITLNSTSEGTQGEYGSRESAAESYIEVIVGTPPTSPAKLSSTSKLDGAGAATIVHEVTLLQQPGFSQLQPDAVDGQDAEIWDQSPNNNYGGAAETWVSSAGSDTTRSLLRFNTGAIPAGAQILQATLSLERQSGAGADQPVSAHRIRNSWSEDSVTWNEREAGTNWDTPGADFDIAAITTTPVGPVNQRYAWNITPLVQGWVDGSYPNHGVALVAAIAGMPGERFYTSDEADPSRWPSLSVAYACACGQVCAPVQGSGNLLMVVISPTVLVAEDQKAKDLFESWGYTVSVISESANQSSYDAAVAANDVVFISETVNSNQVGTKLANAPIGVVSQDGDYNPDLGLAPGASLKVGNAIDIVSTDHYITRPFAVGAHEIYTADMEQAIVTGSVTADQQTLAEIGGDGSLVVLDQGDAMEGGGNAAGRRVILPLGTRYRFDWDYLNANGRLLVQRALEWGMSKDKVSKGNLLLVVPDPAALSTQDSARKVLIESWDYTIALIDDDDTQPNFDAAMAANDVVYVPSTVDETAVAGKLSATGKGIVFEHHKLVQEFGLADNTDTGSVTSSVDIVDNTHYVTEPFALGPLTIFATANETRIIHGTLAPGLQSLAEGSGKKVLDALDAGATRFDSAPSPGRRIKMPWGQASFDPAWLSADGELVMKRAIEWGASVINLDPPVAHWKLDETAGPTAVDSINGYDGALANNPAWTPGLLDGALDFDGVDDDIDVGPEPALDDLFASGATLTGWIRARGWGEGSYGRIADKSNATYPGAGWAFELYGPAQALLFQMGYTGATGSWATPAGAISLDTWHHVAVVFDSSDAANDPAIYIDGVAQTINELDAPSGTPDPDDAYDLHLGNHAQSTVRTFDGLLDDIRLFDRMLSATEIEDLATLPGPVAHWKLDDGAGLTAIDSEGGNDGTLSGPPAWVAGVLGDALDFNGSNDYVDAGTFDISGSGITMMGWFNAEAIATDDGRFVSKASGANEADAYWQLSTTDSGSDRFLRMRVKASGTTTTLADSSVNLSTGSWYFAVGTYDTASGMMRLYLNGVEVASTAHAVGGVLDTDASVPVAIGANGTAERFFNGILDDVRVYNRALDAGEIQDLYDASAPETPGFTELYEPWSATVDATWQTVDLAPFGVPENAVVEVAMVNAKNKNERWGGVRAVGSGLDRRLRLHEAEGGGVDALTMHVQTDSASQIQHYSEKKGELTFILLGYWAGASYTELMEPFSADSSNSWVEENLADDGLGPNQVAEIVMLNTNSGNERLAGVRPSGTTYQRRFNLHEAESGGVDAVTMMVNTDASSIAEVFATNATDVDFYVVGYWSTPPGTYTETGGVHGQASAASTWEQANLATFGVPADSVAQFVVSTEVPNFARRLGVRELGSTNNRTIELQEAEEGGSDNASMHVNVDASARIEWYSASGTSDRYFYPVGWWVLSP